MLKKEYYDICKNYPFYKTDKEWMNFESIIETGKKYNDISFKIRNLIVYRDFKNLKYNIEKSIIYTALTIVSIISTLNAGFKIEKVNLYENNKELIDEYDKNLEEYASSFDTKTMSTMEIIMTVMNDIRSNTKYGFDYDVEEISYYPRLVLNSDNNIGVCRHMADKFTTVMNMINPEFKAYNLSVDLNENPSTFIPCNITSNFSKQFRENYNNSNSNEQLDDKDSIISDHMVTILKPIEDNYYLVVDVTNTSIGILDDGKIYMFNSGDYSFIEYKPFSQFFMSIDGSYSSINMEFILSYFKNINLDELNRKYGVNAQNRTLEKIKTLK